MTEEEFEQEVYFYQQEIMKALAHANPHFGWETEVPELTARFNTLTTQDDLTHFYRLCGRLLGDERREIRLGALNLISTCRIRSNILSLALVHIVQHQKSLREEALLALWPVRTRHVLPQLLSFAEKGYPHALQMIRRMLQTPQEIEQAITIARNHIGNEEYEIREAALLILQRYSTIEMEAERVLAAVQKYTDETFIYALREAPPEIVLEPLKELRSVMEEKAVKMYMNKFREKQPEMVSEMTKELRSAIAEDCAECIDLSSTIEVLEQKKTQRR
jgi:hypothetical protein